MPNIALFPVPRSCRYTRSRHDYRHTSRLVVAPGYSDAFMAHVIAFRNEVGEFLPIRPMVCAESLDESAVFLRILPPAEGLPAQGYELRTSRAGLVLAPADEAGAYYGLQTLAQIIAHTGPVVPGCLIRDYPDFRTRGVMLDISRCKVPTMETLRVLIDRLARMKINHLQLYTEHTFAYAAHQTVWHDSSPVTAEQVLTLDRYCRDRYIELVPNQNSFGHFERWLRHPEYHHLAECPNGSVTPWGVPMDHGSTLRPGRQSLELLASLYDELLPNFTSRQFNVGCDETWELGKGASRKRCEKRGTTRVYLDFLRKIARLVAKHDRRMQFWGDIILHEPSLVAELPRNVVALEWGYEADHPFDEHCAHFAAAGIPFFVCPGTSSWNAITGRTTNALTNLFNAARSGVKHGGEGYLITDWGDGGHHQYLPVSYVGFMAGAAYGWAVEANRRVDVAGAIDRLVVKDAAGVMGAVLLALGDVHRLTGVTRSNRTVFNELFFGSGDDVEQAAQSIGLAALRTCERSLATLDGRLGEARLMADDGRLTVDEISNAIAMARFAVNRALGALGKVGAGELRAELQGIVGAHERLWLARNRPGGLHESSARPRAVLARLPGEK